MELQTEGEVNNLASRVKRACFDTPPDHPSVVLSVDMAPSLESTLSRRAMQIAPSLDKMSLPRIGLSGRKGHSLHFDSENRVPRLPGLSGGQAYRSFSEQRRRGWSRGLRKEARLPPDAPPGYLPPGQVAGGQIQGQGSKA